MDQHGRPYTVEPSNPDWQRQFEKEAAILTGLLQGLDYVIEHIGSTAVAGMWAKPQIDILVVLRSLDEVRRRQSQFVAAGYTALGDYTGKGEEYFVRDAKDGRRTVSVHVRAQDSPDVFAQVILRDYLREHPTEVAAYSEVKRQVYDAGKTDRADYGQRKKAFLLGLIERAQAWAVASGWKAPRL